LAAIEKERPEAFETEGGAELGVVAEFGMCVEREMRAVDGEIVFEQRLQKFVAFASPRMGWAPKEAVMDDQKVRVGANGKSDCGERGVDGCRNASDRAAIFDLQAIRSALVIFYVRGTQHAIAMRDNRFQRCFCHKRIETESLKR
jgi:hypothetical protein